MRFSSALFATSLATSAEAAKLLICSDSTTANYATGNALQGWGYYIGDYLGLTISNLAKNGRSTRSFINEGLWSTLLSSTASGDFVVIEMGHNDDGDPTTSDRATLPGTGENTVTVTTTTGTKEVVHTFGWYLRKMIADVKAKGATPIISGMVNRNYWTGNTLQSNWPFANDAKSVADDAGVEYIDHTKYSVALFQAMGSTKAKTYFPNDNTHTNWDGAKLNAQTFVQAIKYKCGAASKLKSFINSAGNAINNPGQQGSCPASPTTKPATTIKTSSAPATSQTGKPGTVPQYGQCGGSGWTGGTVCVSPYKCTVANEWYSQCL